MDIRILPSDIANMIAAGEVVQRPASVVKELAENAVDAGASKVSVIVRDSGRTLVQVIDNGCGMTPDEAVLCFQRHATSKIASAEDLDTIMTYGFRGEALPSIASVSRVTLKTRTADMEVGTQVTISGMPAISDAPAANGDALSSCQDLTAQPRQDIREVATPVGSNFAVADLYYNTPARRKFLKSDAAELRHITEEFTRIALPNPSVAFSLTSNDRDLLRLGPVSTLLFRIRDIFGQSISDDLLPLKTATTVASLEGFVAKAPSARKTGAEQYLFVNGRYFRSPYLHKAVMKAYENLIPEGTSPSYFIFLTLDPRMVDINVHPTKTEVKFEDDNVLFSVVMAAVKDALGRDSFGERLDFDRGSLPQVHNIGSSFEEYRTAADPSLGSNPDFNPFDSDGFPNQGGWEASSRGASCPPRQDFSQLFPEEDKDAPLIHENQDARSSDSKTGIKNAAPLIINGRHIIMSSPSGFILVDAQRAMQRIMYEHFIEALTKSETSSQAMLFPIEVELGPANMQTLQSSAATLGLLGFELAPFSATSVLVSAVPSGVKDDKMSVTALIFELVTALQEERGSLAASMFSPLAGRLAASAARCATLPSDEGMARSLIEQLYNSENPEFTPDGHKTVAVLKSDEIEKILK